MTPEPSLTRTARAVNAARKIPPRPRSGIALALLGVLVLLGTLALDALGKPINVWLWLGVGGLFMFGGFFVRHPAKALTAGGFVVNSVGGLMTIVRTGRRATDPVVAVPVVTDTPSQEFPAPVIPPAEPQPTDPQRPGGE